MRDLSSEELIHVYGAGGRGKSPCPPRKQPKSKCKSRGGKGSSSGGYGGGRCGRGGSS